MSGLKIHRDAIDAAKVVRADLIIQGPVGLKALCREPTAFREHLRLTFEDGSQRDVLPSELPTLAARFFSRYLGCRDAIATALKVNYGGRK